MAGRESRETFTQNSTRENVKPTTAPGLSPNPQPSGVPPRGTKHQEGLVIPSSPPLGQGVSRYDIRVVQSPSDCILRSVSPLCRLRSDVSGPPSLTPWVSVVARQTPPRPCLCQWVRMEEGRVSSSPSICQDTFKRSRRGGIEPLWLGTSPSPPQGAPPPGASTSYTTLIIYTYITHI